MIIRLLYSWVVRLHPRWFREAFGEEMMSIFEDASAERSILPLFADVARQWVIRSEPRHPRAVSSNGTHAIDGVPAFYLAEKSLPDPGSIVSGGMVTILIVIAACFLISGSGNRVTFYSPLAHFHRKQQRRLTNSSPANFKMISGKFDKPEPSIDTAGSAGPEEHWALISKEPSASTVLPPQDPGTSKLGRDYLQLIRLLAALDADGDGVISSTEIANAPAVLRKLDTNHDGSLTPEECGFRGYPRGIEFLTGSQVNAAEERRRFLERTRPAFMRFHPVIGALDADRSGAISADEIRHATALLRTLDRNRDGQITEEEYLPDPVENLLTLIMSRLDVNGDGKITREERTTAFAEHYRELLDRADLNHDGIVTEQELRSEIHRRADLDRDGVVTWNEMLRAQRSGAFGTLAEK